MPLLHKKDARPDRILSLPVNAIHPNPDQPRRFFDRDGLEELADSIRALGILQPLTVRRTPEGWELVAGERRLRAAALAGLDRVPCIPIQSDSQGSSLLARWQAFRKLTQVTPSDHGRVILAKKRYIDPCTAEGRRASQLDEEFSRELSGFLSYSFQYPREGC